MQRAGVLCNKENASLRCHANDTSRRNQKNAATSCSVPPEAMLRRNGIPHNVLNAKHHEREAEIVAMAGKKGRVTISTNMAGRGTDIMLGGNAEFMAKQEMRKMMALYLPSMLR